MPTEFTPMKGLIGGLLIGIASVIMLFGTGRIAGVSGIMSGLIPPLSPDKLWRILFIAGLLSGAFIWLSTTRLPLELELQAGTLGLMIAGFLVGMGSRIANGCTSGHGISGIARLSLRSIVAAFTFVVFAMTTTYFIRHILAW